MGTSLPQSKTYVIIGAGVHGLSTAWHLAMELKATGKGSGKDIVVLDKSLPGAGASGIACGCVRNFYMTEPMHALIRHSVDVWNYDPVALGFQQVGYISCGDQGQISDYERIHKSQQSVDYNSDMYTGKDAHNFLKNIWPDFQLHNVEVILHEKISGYSGTLQAIKGLTQMCQRHGVEIFSGVEVQGYEMANKQVSAVETNKGKIRSDMVVLAVGAWVPKHWQMLKQPMKLDIGYSDGSNVKDKDMWTYWRLEEGEVYYDGPYYTADNLNPPVLHIELMNTPVLDPKSGEKLKDYVYVYWKNGTERMERPGIQGGGMPVMLGAEAELDPYGHANDKYQADTAFADYLTACMEMFMGRFKNTRGDFKERRNGGIGAFTPDNVPILDWIMPNVYMIADSNHGYKALGIGKLLARHLCAGEKVAELTPFAFDRFANGKAYGSGTTNCPWV